MKLNQILHIFVISFNVFGNHVSAQCTMAIDLSDTGSTSQPSGSRRSSKSSKGSKSKTRARLNLDNFPSECEESDEISINLRDSVSTYKMKKKGKTPKSSKSGKSSSTTSIDSSAEKVYMSGDSDDGSSINLLRKPNGHIIGSISDSVQGIVMQIDVDDNGSNIVDITSSEDFPPELDAYDNFTIKDEFYPYQKPLGSILTGNNTLRRANTGVAIIDIMVVWTRRAECAHAGKGSVCTVDSSTLERMEDLIDLAVLETNTAYENSGVNIQLDLIHSYRTDYVEPSSNAFSQTLNDLRGSTDGKMDEVHALRETYGADLVVAIIDDPNYCGVAYIGPGIDRMFSVVNWSCATGYYSFGHEIGHNMGLTHDRGTTNKCGQGSYNYGYRDPSGAFRSIMAYNCRTGQCDNIQKNGCSRIQRFSNPDQSFAGKPLGTTTENAARWLNEVGYEIANYYERKSSCLSASDCVEHMGDPCYVASCNGVCTYANTCLSPRDQVCGNNKIWMQVDVQLDNYPAETSWRLVDVCSQEIVATMTGKSGDSKLGTEEFNLRTISQPKSYICIEKKQYVFTIFDSYGDGICCSYGAGSYSIAYEGMQGNAITGGSFTNEMSHNIDLGSCSDATPMPTSLPTLKPSTAPTTKPTKTPTKSPVSIPPPTIVSPRSCFDDSSFTFKLDEGSTQSCAWLTTNERKNAYCDRGHVKGACKASCDFCNCQDDMSFKFNLLNVGRKRRCNWLTKNLRRIQARRATYCFADDFQSASFNVGSACVDSCGFCTP